VIGHSARGHNAISQRFSNRGSKKAVVSVVRLQQLPLLLQGQYRRLVAQGGGICPGSRIFITSSRTACRSTPRANRALAPRAFFTNPPFGMPISTSEGDPPSASPRQIRFIGLFGVAGAIEGVYPDAGNMLFRRNKVSSYAFPTSAWRNGK